MAIKCALLILSLSFSLSLWADSHYSIYLVRHAEKHKEGDNPSLTICGKARAEQLASLLSQAKIKKVYSSPYQRTQQTATPLAIQQHIAIQTYNPKHLGQLAILLQQRQENTLVVGHSNTTPQLAALLSKQKIALLSEDNFKNLYQIQFIAGQTLVTQLTLPLVCDESL